MFQITMIQYTLFKTTNS